VTPMLRWTVTPPRARRTRIPAKIAVFGWLPSLARRLLMPLPRTQRGRGRPLRPQVGRVRKEDCHEDQRQADGGGGDDGRLARNGGLLDGERGGHGRRGP